MRRAQGISVERRTQLVTLGVRGAALLFILALPLFLVTSNLRLAFNGNWLYAYGFDRYKISEATEIPEGELHRIAGEIIEYWDSDSALLGIEVSGQPLYNQREVLHLRDVKGLVQGVFRIQRTTGILLLIYIGSGLLLARRGFLDPLARQARLGGVLTLGLLLVTGIALAAAFPWLFRLFHLISFSNDFWQLDPQRDNLIRMFPQGFWFLATMLVVLLTVAEAALLTMSGWLGLRYLQAQVGLTEREEENVLEK